MKRMNLLILLITLMVIVSCNSEETFTDSRDNQTYKTIKIGNQYWMAENINFETESGSGPYQDDSSLSKVYGRLYSWKTAREVCPDGWHLPSDEEWTEFIDYLGGENTAGGKMKTPNAQYWKSPNSGATNNSGFSALPGGYALNSIIRFEFDRLGENTYFWSSTRNNDGNVWVRTLSFEKESVARDWFGPAGYYLSVRCIKD